MMVEVPAAALCIDRFEADFYSIGSNDLIQYTNAASRDCAGVAQLYDPRSPAVLELIARVAAHGARVGREVSLCGDMAAEPALVPLLLDAGLLHGGCLTVTGRTVAENLAGVKPYPEKQDIVRPLADPIKPDSHLAVLYGNLAPGGSVAKISGKEGLRFEGRARVDSEATRSADSRRRGRRGDVVVIRYEGPKARRACRDAEPDRRYRRPWARRQSRAHHRRSVLGR
jgi:hypothetical protein